MIHVPKIRWSQLSRRHKYIRNDRVLTLASILAVAINDIGLPLMNTKLILVILVVFVGLLTWFSISSTDSEPPSQLSEADSDYSNIHPDDYVGPEACAKCHSSHHKDWLSHAHSKMNLNPDADSVVGDFSGKRVNYGTDEVAFENENGDYFMSFYQENKLSRRYRVTRTVGSRLTQMYIGLQTVGPEAESHHAYTIEGKLPFGYWMARKLWTPVSYFDSAYEAEPDDESARAEELSHTQKDVKWELNCLYCHNTYPYQHRLYFASALGFPREDFRFPGGAQTLVEWGALTPQKLVSLGISCESCHYGGREHVEHGRPMRYYPTSPKLKVTDLPDGDLTNHANVINSICAQCHCAKVDLFPNGAATWNSREALDLKSGACQQQVKCTDCHNPHLPGRDGGLFSESQIVDRCTECHQQFRDNAAVARHTHHLTDSVNCLDCHMPRIVQGLDSVIRTHHICSPTDTVMLKMAGPNACNLCHIDRSVSWTVTELNKNWGLNIRTDNTWSSVYGESLDHPLADAWLNHSRPLMRLLATDAIRRSPFSQSPLPKLLSVLKDRFAVNRMFALFAVEELLGRQLSIEEYDPLAARSELVDSAASLMRLFSAETNSRTTSDQTK